MFDHNATNGTAVPNFKAYSTFAEVVLWILTLILSLETILGNILVLMSFYVDRSLRQPSNYFIASLAISDLIIGVEGFPVLTYYVLSGERWLLGSCFCKFWLSLDYTLCLVSILTVLLITVDRYCSVCHTANYRNWQTLTKTRSMIVGSWVGPVVLFGLTIFAWEYMTGATPMDALKCYAPFLNDPFVNMSMYIVYYWTTLVAMIVLYHGIHNVAKTLQEKGEAKEKQMVAMAALQRCMAQMGVGLMIAAKEDQLDMDQPADHEELGIDTDKHNTYLDSGYSTTARVSTTTMDKVSVCQSQRLPQTKDMIPKQPSLAATEEIRKGSTARKRAGSSSISGPNDQQDTPLLNPATGLMEGSRT